MKTIREFYRLAKPGIVYGNVLSTIAAFFFALTIAWNLQLFLATVFGIGLVIASACVFNNYLDVDIDRRMQRTSNRALVTGEISVTAALLFGAILGMLGFMLLLSFVNLLTAAVAAFGFVMYVFVYGVAKRMSAWGALVGSIPGAVPIVVGYTAITGTLDITALFLFLSMVCWQMPHFYGIAMYRLTEYEAADIPVFPARKGILATKRHIVFFIAAFGIATILLGFVAHLSLFYFVVMAALSLYWLYRGVKGFGVRNNATKDEKWGRGIFLYSLIALLVFCASIALFPHL